MKIKVFYKDEPVLEVKWDEQQKANYGLHRDRRPDRDWGEYRWGRMDEKGGSELSEVELTPELKKILIEDICEHYNGENSYLKLMEFGLINQFPYAITKEIAIKRFKEVCADPMNSERRKIAIENQYDRNTWDIIDRTHFFRPLLIRISNNIERGELTIFTPSHNYTFHLSVSEYQELEKLYFGEFKPDYDYLEKLGVIFDGK